MMRRVHSLPLSQFEFMTLSYIPLFAVTYLFWWVKPKDVLTSSIVDLPDMLEGQKATFESMAVSKLSDNEDIGKQNSLWAIWYLTPRVFEKEAEDRARQRTQQQHSQEIESIPIRRIKRAENLEAKFSTDLLKIDEPQHKEVVVGNWDPGLYKSKILWPVICLFGASFGALHLIA
ncbi:MAG: hypothetical protein Q9201_002047 [Fulgogasparrea decipioides]